MKWITEKGIDYLTKLIDQMGTSKWSIKKGRKLDILGLVERRGGGLSDSQIISLLASRDIETPLTGTREQYLEAMRDLEMDGYIEDLSR